MKEPSNEAGARSMEALTRLVAESFARHGFDRPVDYRRLHWSRWFPCESPHSLLFVPSKPGVFGLAEELMDFGSTHVGTAALGCPAERSSPPVPPAKPLGGAVLQRCDSSPTMKAALAAEGQRRMLAVLQFWEDDDMAFVLDRMFTRENPMRARLASGRCFVRFVALEDPSQRRSICNALNQWLISSSEVTTGIGAHFASSLELTDSNASADRVGPTLWSANAGHPAQSELDLKTDPDPLSVAAPSSTLDSGAAANMHCPSPLPSGF